MKLYSWNVNGFRSAVRKGFWDWFLQAGPDVVSLQEIKALPEQLSEGDRNPPGYEAIWNPARDKKGYSGTACFCRRPPLEARCGFHAAFSGEGRLVQVEYEQFFLLNVYFPNGKRDNSRVPFKLAYYEKFLEHAEELRRKKPVVVCGDFNTAHTEIDLKNPKSNAKHSGFLPEERAWMDRFMEHGYVDTLRMFKTGPGYYTWWSAMFNAREKNVGWRIDYFFVSEELKRAVKKAWIEPEVQGSDHCPIGLELDCI